MQHRSSKALMRRFAGTVVVLFGTLSILGTGGGGGGGDDPGGGGGGGGGGTPTPSGSNIVVLTSNSQLPSDADTQPEGVTITAIVTDTNNNVVAGVPVTFSSAGNVAGPASGGALIVTQATTNASGVATAVLTTGGNTTLRTITVTGRTGSIADSVLVNVVNPGGAPPNATPAVLNLVGDASQLLSNADTIAEGINLTAFVSDANGVLLQGITVSFAAPGAGIAITRATTDASGTATAILHTGGDPTPRTITVTSSITGGPSDTLAIDVINPIASVVLTTSSPQLLSSANTAAEGITLTATVKDSNNTVLSGIDVAFFSSSGALQVTRGTTDASGTAIAILTTGGDPSNRDITVTATAAGPTTDTLVIPVTGTTLTLNGPSSLGFNTTGNYSVTLRNAAGEPISGADLTVTSAQGNQVNGAASPATVTTGSTGQANFTLTVGTADDTLTVSGAGASPAVQAINVVNTILSFTSPAADTNVALSAGQPITVHFTLNGADAPNGTVINFATTRGTIPATAMVAGGAGNATVTFTAGTSPGSAIITASHTASGVSSTLQLNVVSTTPASINVQAQPNVVNVNGQTTIQAVVRDPNSNPVANQTVTFTVSNGPGSVSPGTGVTNSQGVVTTTYSAPSQPTASNGVTITATVQSNPGVTGSTTLTVGGQALHISLGTGITISDDGVTRYNLPYSVLVNDSNGNPPAAGTNVNLQVLSLRFYEGFYVAGPNSRWVPASDPNNDLILDPKVGCDSEDVNFNGVLNAGEDTHVAGPYQSPPTPTLEPGNVASVPATVALNAGGTADFNVNYLKAFCSWVQVRLQATTAVAGTEASAVATFDLPCSNPDLGTSHAPPGGSIESPFGTDGNCSTAPLEPTECSDNVDNDGDGLTDNPADPGCDSPADTSETALVQCDDTVDNDGDTFTDFPADAGCASAASNNESPACNDGIDNDGDGDMDFPADPGCASASDTAETSLLACDDGIDNDGDGQTDLGVGGDPGCADNSADNDETSQCDDGADNDMDTFTDFPDDPECPNTADNDEAA